MNHSGNPIGRQPEPKPVTNQLTGLRAPDWFGPYGKAAFKLLKPLLLPILSADMVLSFYILCETYGKIIETQKTLTEHGLTVINAKGCLVKNPVWSIHKEATMMFNSLCCQFGLTPSARARLNVNQPTTEEDDGIGALINQAKRK